MKAQDITKRKFGRLIVIARAGTDKEGHSKWSCRCRCGKIVEIIGKSLRSGHTQSCGCRNKEIITKHGHSRNPDTPEYRIWIGMKTRCYQKSCSWYHRYGGRGIRVCTRWLNSFENFLLDVGKRPSKKHTIERKKNNRDYSPDNCCWATPEEQSNNQERTIRVTVNGITKPLTWWCKDTHINRQTAYARIKRGVPGHLAVTVPPGELHKCSVQ